MNQPTLGLLARLRPPPGYQTAAALGATYSADLLTCMAVLTTMDGGEGEQVRYGRIEAYRALDRLRDKVRICYQAGRLCRRDGTRYPSLALLDRLLIPVRLPNRGSFHPKVWLVRQVDDAAQHRFVLVVSSRNVTTSTDWDLGISVEGVLGGKGVALPRVRDFAAHVLTLAGEPERLATFGQLEEVRWTIPVGVREIEFDFQSGGHEDKQLHSAWGRFPGRLSRVLLLSPFINARMVDEAATRWQGVSTRRLVAGTEGLMTVALGHKRTSLKALSPRQIVAAVEEAEPPEVDLAEGSEEEDEQVRALHAKVIAMDDGHRGTIVVGSANLTTSGWCGGSTEAFVRLVGDAQICEPLWDWAGAHAQEFTFPDLRTPPPAPPLLKALQDELHLIAFRLEEHPGMPVRLSLIAPRVLALPDNVQMEVARYTTPRDMTPFPSGNSSVELVACPSALRTHFVVCTLRHADDETSWIAAAALDPPLGDERDHELVARLLGLRPFLAYLQSLRGSDIILDTNEGERDEESPKGPAGSGGAGSFDEVHLEGLLRQLVEEPRAFAEMDDAVARYAQLIGRGQLSPADKVLLGRFLEAWTAIQEGFRS